MPAVPAAVYALVQQRCPNCGGNLWLGGYTLGRYEVQCLLCWYSRDYNQQGQPIEPLRLRHQLTARTSAEAKALREEWARDTPVIRFIR